MAIVATGWRKLFAANQGTIFGPAVGAAQEIYRTTVFPSGVVFQGMRSVDAVRLIPFGAGLATQTYTLTAWGMEVNDFLNPTHYFLHLLFDAVTVTLGTSVGLAGADILATDLIGDTISAPAAHLPKFNALLEGALEAGGAEAAGPGGNHFNVLQVMTGGLWGVFVIGTLVTATSWNVLYQLVTKQK